MSDTAASKPLSDALEQLEKVVKDWPRFSPYGHGRADAMVNVLLGKMLKTSDRRMAFFELYPYLQRLTAVRISLDDRNSKYSSSLMNLLTSKLLSGGDSAPKETSPDAPCEKVYPITFWLFSLIRYSLHNPTSSPMPNLSLSQSLLASPNGFAFIRTSTHRPCHPVSMLNAEASISTRAQTTSCGTGIEKAMKTCRLLLWQ